MVTEQPLLLARDKGVSGDLGKCKRGQGRELGDVHLAEDARVLLAVTREGGAVGASFGMIAADRELHFCMKAATD